MEGTTFDSEDEPEAEETEEPERKTSEQQVAVASGHAKLDVRPGSVTAPTTPEQMSKFGHGARKRFKKAKKDLQGGVKLVNSTSAAKKRVYLAHAIGTHIEDKPKRRSFLLAAAATNPKGRDTKPQDLRTTMASHGVVLTRASKDYFHAGNSCAF